MPIVRTLAIDKVALMEAAREYADVPNRLGADEKKQIADRIRFGFSRTFESEGPAPMRWPELAARTIRERRDAGFPGEHPILQRTRNLMYSWTDPGHSDHVEDWGTFAGFTILVVGSEHPHVDLLTTGSTLLRLPPRPMHLLADEDIAQIDHAIVEALERAAAKLD